ncbi:MAG: membrane-bound lytic murein transglycosylase MltF [Pseudomonadota bacterium]
MMKPYRYVNTHTENLPVGMRLLVIGLVCLLSVACSENKPLSHIAQIKEKGELHIVTRNNPTTYYVGPQGPTGIEYELAQSFANFLNVELVVTVADNNSDILNLVSNQQVDLAAAGLTITPDREFDVRFGPSYQEVTQKLVFKQGEPWPRNIEQLNGELRITSNSSHSEELIQLKSRFPGLSWSETSELSSEELMTQVLNGEIAYTIADSNELALHRRFYPELSIAFSVDQPKPLAWAFSKKTDDTLYLAAIEFFGKINDSGKLSALIDRYYGHVAKFDYVGTRSFLAASQKKLSQYEALFKEAAFQFDLDWRLLAAVSYQESLWNPKAKSPTGVRGMMMLTLPTAKQMKIKNRLDPKESIMGGAKYLKKILVRLPKTIDTPDRTWFALASYNVGWGHVNDARIITEQQGGNPNKWVDVKERLPLLRQKQFYKKTKFGYARGNEPVIYVSNVRLYYDTLAWLHQEPTHFDLPTPNMIPETMLADNSVNDEGIPDTQQQGLESESPTTPNPLKKKTAEKSTTAD